MVAKLKSPAPDSSLPGMTSEITEGVSLEWWTLDDCLTKKWKRNDKLHDLNLIASSIERYGFKDPCKYSLTLDGFEEGNGRVEVLANLRARGPRPGSDAQWPPRGIRTGLGGEWTVPVLIGVDAETIAEAESYAIDHNNTVVAGAGFDLDTYLKLWGPNFQDLLFDLHQNGYYTESIDSEDVDTLLAFVKSAPIPLTTRSPDAERGVTQEQEKQQFLGGQLRQITFYLDAEVYPGAVEKLEAYRFARNLEDHTAAFINLIEEALTTHASSGIEAQRD